MCLGFMYLVGVDLRLDGVIVGLSASLLGGQPGQRLEPYPARPQMLHPWIQRSGRPIHFHPPVAAACLGCTIGQPSIRRVGASRNRPLAVYLQN